MCGFVGCSSVLPIRNFTWLSSSLKLISHRGPNESGDFFSQDKCIGMAHCRLSIIDLTDMANQPISLVEIGLFSMVKYITIPN